MIYFLQFLLFQWFLSWKITKKKVTDSDSDIFVIGIKVAGLSRRLTWKRGGSSRVASKQVMMNSLYWVTQGLKELFNSDSITVGTPTAKDPKDFYHVNPTTSAISNEFILN